MFGRAPPPNHLPFSCCFYVRANLKAVNFPQSKEKKKGRKNIMAWQRWRCCSQITRLEVVSPSASLTRCSQPTPVLLVAGFGRRRMMTRAVKRVVNGFHPLILLKFIQRVKREEKKTKGRLTFGVQAPPCLTVAPPTTFLTDRRGCNRWFFNLGGRVQVFGTEGDEEAAVGEAS